MSTATPEMIKDARELKRQRMEDLSKTLADLKTRNSLAYVSRTKGLRPFFDPHLNEIRLMDVYAENVPEALIDWCSKNQHHLIVIHEGELPEIDGRTPYERYGDQVSEVLAADLSRGFKGRKETSALYQERYEELLADESFRSAFSYMGVSLFDTLDQMPSQFASVASGFAHGVEKWTDMLAKLGPKAVFAGRLDVRPEICVACSRLGMTSVGVKLGIAEEMLAPFAWSNGDGGFNADAFPDVLGVWGATQKKLIESRFPEVTSFIVASGRTRNDTFQNVEAEDLGADVRAHLGLDPDTHVVLYGANQATKFGKVATREFGAACMSPLTYRSTLQMLVEYAAEEGDMFILVKPHPSDDLKAIAAVVESLKPGPVDLLTDQDGFHNANILSASDVFVSSVSSMFSEAVLAGKPAINIWTPDVNYLYEGGRLDAFNPISIATHNGQEIIEVIKRLRQDKNYYDAEMARMNAGLEDIFGASDGSNAKRLVEQAMIFHESKKLQA